MKNHLVLVIPVLVVLGIGLIIYGSYEPGRPAGPAPAPATTTTQASYKDATYTIDGSAVALRDGHSVMSADGVATITTDYFGNEAMGDLNGDGQDDVAFVLTQSAGGSGTFYYAVAALKTAAGWQGTNAVLLGDRVAPQSTQVEYGEAVVNYADRKPGEPMSAQPSLGQTKYLVVKDGVLAEIPANEYAAGNLLLGTDGSPKHLIGSNGMTLYVLAKDPTGACVEQCAINWPPYIVPDERSLANLQAGIAGTPSGTLRADGTLQVTYNGAPLYYFKNDTKPGDTLGAGVGNGMWAVAKP